MVFKQWATFFFKNFRNSMQFPLIKDGDVSSWQRNANSWLAIDHTASINRHTFHLLLLICLLCLVMSFLRSASTRASTFVFVPKKLTVDNSAQEFVLLSDYAANLTNDLNPNIPSCLLEESKQTNSEVCLLFHILLTSRTFHNERCQNVMYIVLS